MIKRNSATIGLGALALSAVLTLSACGGGGGGVSAGAFCKEVQVASERFAGLQDLNLKDPSSKSEIQKAATAVQQLADSAPAQIKADAELGAMATAELARGNPAPLNSSAVAAADDRLDAWESDHCPQQ